MLSYLRIKNLALVENLSITFETGLNTITGETGAGKSILIGALGLLLGNRADKTLIRTGETSCSVEAQFDITGRDRIAKLFEETDLELSEDEGLILRRTIKAAGSGQIMANDQPVSLQFLKQLGILLVDMHGPYDHQSLLNQDEQLRILDAFAQTEKESIAYQKQYSQYRELMRQRKTLEQDDGDLEDQIDILRYRVQEISEAKLSEGEEEEVLQEHTLLANSSNIIESANQVLDPLIDGEANALDLVARIHTPIEKMAKLFPSGEAWSEEANQISILIKELAGSIQGELGDLDANPERLEWLDERLSTYDRIKRKYGGSVASALEQLKTSKKRLNDLENHDEELQRIDAELKTLVSTLKNKGKALTKKRSKASEALSEQITLHLRDMGFDHGSFSVDFSEVEPTSSGLDLIDFGFAPNMGETMRPLRAIASSGEIARVMLAVKAVLAAHDTVPVLIFDEIDANVGGEMGHAIGEKMREVAKHHQVLAITHLPQVAVHGEHHLMVRKSTTEGRTFTQVEPMEEDKRIEEIARMLGGVKLTDITLDHAKALLENAVK